MPPKSQGLWKLSLRLSYEEKSNNNTKLMHSKTNAADGEK